VRVTTQTKPEGATHWSTRKLAARLGISDTSVLKVWRANGLKPHLVKSFKVSRDPKFVEKLEDIVGLYMSPPEHALVLCCDEKSQVQALDRTQPGLAAEARTRSGNDDSRLQAQRHDHTVRGDEHTGRLGDLALCPTPPPCRVARPSCARSTAQTPSDKSLHLICDNYATHKHPKVKEWLARSIRASISTSRRPPLLAQHGRALLPRISRPGSPAQRRLSQRPRIDCRHRGVHRRA
jgi:hypothetical protein